MKATKYQRLKEKMDIMQRDFVVNALTDYDGNINLACRETGMPRRSMYNIIKKFDIDIDDFRPDS